MSLVTRCPACATTFKVVRDQLRISDGWVRCGRCSEVFDANADLHEESEGSPAALPAAGPAAIKPEPDTGVRAEPEPEPASLPPPPGIVLDDEPWPDFPMPETPAPSPVSTLHPAFPDIDLNMPAPPVPARAAITDDSVEDDDADSVPFQKALRRARVKAAKAARAARQDEAKSAESSVQSSSVAVVQTASEPAAQLAVTPTADLPAKPASLKSGVAGAQGARRWLWPAAVLAALLLMGQVVHHNRDLIAARQPALRPALEAWCGVAGCELSALRRISDIVIDGAAFARVQGGEGYRLSFTLRNAATVPLATPAVELTLLDTQERAVVRRVLQPADFAVPLTLPARAEHAVSLPLKLNANEAAALPPVAGYRVVAFYP